MSLPQLEVNTQNKFGYTALMLAVKNSHSDIVHLLSHRHDVDLGMSIVTIILVRLTLSHVV